jgi:VWFA-related protein
MTTILRASVLLMASWCAISPPVTRDQIFRAATDATRVPVSVRDRNRPIAGLTAADFELFDNGVVQKIDSLVVDTVPIDLTVVLDTSASLSEEAVQRFVDELRQMVRLLQPEDRIRVLTFGTHVKELVSRQLAVQSIPPLPAQPDGATAFFNAIVAALVIESTSERPHLVVALGDGGDNMGLIDARDVADVARRSDAVLYLLLHGELGGVGRGWLPFRGPGNLDPLRTAAIATGGKYERTAGPQPVLALVKQAIADFRASYLLWFTPTGVPVPGWHELSVRVRSGKYTVVARKGYFGG